MTQASAGFSPGLRQLRFPAAHGELPASRGEGLLQYERQPIKRSYSHLIPGRHRRGNEQPMRATDQTPRECWRRWLRKQGNYLFANHCHQSSRVTECKAFPPGPGKGSD